MTVRTGPQPPIGGGMPGMPPNPYAPPPQMPAPMPAPMAGGMPLAGGPPPGVNPNMGGNAAPRPDLAQMGSNAPRRRMFGDYLEGTLSRNMPSSMPANATSMGQMNVFTGQQMAPQMAPQQRRPMPMPQQRRPMMANSGGIAGYHEGGGVAHEHVGGNEDSAVIGTNAAAIEMANNALKTDKIQNILNKYGIGNTQLETTTDFYKIIGNKGGLPTNTLDKDAVQDAIQLAMVQGYAGNPHYTTPYTPLSETLATVMNTPGAQMQVSKMVQDALDSGSAGSESYLSTRHSGDRYLTDEEVIARNRALGLTRNMSAAEIEAERKAAIAKALEAAKSNQTVVSGPGTAYTAPSSDAGTYSASTPNPNIDMSQFSGDIARLGPSYGTAALYGPRVDAPQQVSQFIGNPFDGGMSTTNGSIMSAVSGIGGINLPARPVDIDVFDFLSSPAYGSFNRFEDDDVRYFDMGGEVSGPFSGPVQHFDLGGHAHPHGGGNPYAAFAASMKEAGIGGLSGNPVTSEAKTVQQKAMDMVKSMNQRDKNKGDGDDDDDAIIEKYTDTSDMNALDQIAASNFIKDPNIIDNILAGANAGTTSTDGLNNSDIFAASVSPGTDVSGLAVPLDAVVNYANTANDPVAVDYSNILGDGMSVGMAGDASAAVATGDTNPVSLEVYTGDNQSANTLPVGGPGTFSQGALPAATGGNQSATNVPAFTYTSAIDRGLGGADTDPNANQVNVISDTIKSLEGSTTKPYFDVNAFRAGFGSDTYTDPKTGKVTKVTKDSNVSSAQAEADLNRRLTTEFVPSVVNAVGADAFYSLSPGAQAALTSIAYNYGAGAMSSNRFKTMVNAVQRGDMEGVATAIEALADDNDGINKSRRLSEAAMVRSGVGLSAPETSQQLLSTRTPSSDMSKIDTQLQDSVPVQGLAKFLSNVGGAMFFGLGKGLVDDLVGKTEAQRANVVKMHTDALGNGATPQYDDEGKYIGYDKSTMGTFADKVLASDDINVFMPPTTQDSTFTVTQDDLDVLSDTNKLYAKEGANLGSGLNAGDQLGILGITNSNAKANASGLTDADGNVINDITRFQQVFDAQSKAAEADPYGASTENGFITSDGREFVVTLDGKLLEVENSGDPFFNDGTSVVGTGESLLNSGVGTGTDVDTIINTIVGGGDDDGDDDDVKDYNIIDGEYVCKKEGYVYNSDTDSCAPKEESKAETIDDGLNRGSGSSFKEYIPSQVASSIASYNQGGMVNTNRMVDEFLVALGA